MNDAAAVVTGANSGIGAAVMRVLGRAGATVVACAHDDDTLQSVVNDIERDDSNASAVCADVHDELDMERLMETAARTGGRINVLVANAAVAHGTPDEMPAPEDSYATFDNTLRTNVRGIFAVIKEALPHMADDGRILVPSGSIAREVEPGMGAYAVSRATTEALVRQLATDYDRAVTIADPGPIATNLTGGQGRDSGDVADLFVWAATDADLAEFDGDIADLEARKRATC